MKKNRHIIKEVLPGSIAEELELEPGDELLAINGQKIEDVFDYQYLTNDEFLELLVRKADGEEWELEIEKDYEEDLGIEFINSLMDEYRSCRNKCIFCFIDQMPPGMRETLYFKDDDSRLSFLQGNYVTLTNMSDHDIDRIIKFHLAPINISFQTTNPQLRCKMLNNRFAGDVFAKVQRLYEAGIEMNGQIVLCKGVNDGKELERSIEDLSKYLPYLRSVSIVPVGLSKYRENLYPLEPFTKEDAIEVLNLVHQWQEKTYEQYGLHFIHCSDEWYILAEQPLPEEENYDGYIQLENGVGMLRLLEMEVMEELEKLEREKLENKTQEAEVTKRKLTIATGMLAAPFIKENIARIQEKFPNIEADVVAIRNDFFGEMITVSGLITGQDLKKQLKEKMATDLHLADTHLEDIHLDEKKNSLGERLLIPCNMLRAGESVFLDDVTVEELEEELQIPIVVVDEGGAEFVHAVIDDIVNTKHKRRQIYEQANSSNCGAS